MILARTERFKKAYLKLSPQLQKVASEKLLLFANDVRHPSLRVKRVQGTDRFWEASITMSCRMTFEKIEGGYLLRNIGEHDKTLDQP